MNEAPSVIASCCCSRRVRPLTVRRQVNDDWPAVVLTSDVNYATYVAV